jgi:hypothetical protein
VLDVPEISVAQRIDGLQHRFEREGVGSDREGKLVRGTWVRTHMLFRMHACTHTHTQTHTHTHFLHALLRQRLRHLFMNCLCLCILHACVCVDVYIVLVFVCVCRCTHKTRTQCLFVCLCVRACIHVHFNTSGGRRPLQTVNQGVKKKQ